MDNKIIFEGQTKDGKKYLIRYPQGGDAQAMTDYINALSKERTFIRYQGEEITLEDEAKYLQRQLEKIEQKLTIQLLVYLENQIIGISAIDMKDKTESHEGVFGISLARDFRGQGIGKTLMGLVIKEAEKNLSQLKLVTLGVFGDNPLAQEMYKKFGFKEYGRLPEGTKHLDQYVDHIYMYKKVK